MPGRRNLLAGAVFVGAGGATLLIAVNTLPVGTPAEMGPGFFPAAIGIVLLLLGVLVALSPESEGGEAAHPIPWRAGVFLVASILFSAVSIEPLGLVPAIMGSSLLGAFASRRMTARFALALAIGLTALSVVTFKLALGLPLPLFGAWIGG